MTDAARKDLEELLVKLKELRAKAWPKLSIAEDKGK